MIDYPGKMAAVIFTQGCNFRCSYCQNPELVLPGWFHDPLDEQEVLAFLKKREGRLEAVVVTGGEPTVQKDLMEFLGKLRKLKYLIKLDTNGGRPEILTKIVKAGLIDYIAMDVKAPFGKYREAIGVTWNVDRIRESIKIIRESRLAYEFRTTVVRPLCSPTDLAEIASSLQGVKRYVIQRFVPSDKILDHRILEKQHYTTQEVDVFRSAWEIPPFEEL